MMQMGFVTGAWYHLRSAKIAGEKQASATGDAAFYTRKHVAAEFYMAQMLPRAAAYGQTVTQGAQIGTQLDSSSFAA